MAHIRNSTPFDLDEFLGGLRAKLVSLSRAGGMAPAEAEDCAQDAITALLDLVARQPSRIEEPEKLRGWLFLKARSLQIDHHRRTQVRAEQALAADSDEEGRLFELVSNAPNPEESLQRRELLERQFGRFFFELAKAARLDLIDSLLGLARRMFPEDEVNQYLFARIMVFSGKGSTKRSIEDVRSIARSIGKSVGATMTDLTRLQAAWKSTEHDVFFAAQPARQKSLCVQTPLCS